MSKRNRREHGRILSVETMQRGSALDADAAAGATSITVTDAGDFDEDGGWLYIGAQVVEFTECDDDTGIITLADPLTSAAEQGDPVAVYDPLYEEVVDYQVALVQLDGEYDNPDPVEAEVAEQVEDLPEGDRGAAGESCTLKRVADDEWEVVEVGGRPRKSKGIKFEADDIRRLTAGDITAGTATIRLSHQPIKESLVAWWEGEPQRPTEFTIDYDARMVTWPLAGFEEAGDELWVHYAYRKGLHRDRVAVAATGTSHWDVPITPPAAQEGDLLVLAIALDSASTGVTALNGYTAVGVTSSFTRTLFGLSQTYRLGVYARICPAGSVPVPTFDNVTRDCPWAMAAVTGATGIADSAVGTKPNAHSAATPDVADTVLRVFAVLGENPVIDPPGVTVAQNMTDREPTDTDQIAIMITVDRSNDVATVDTTDGTEAGDWMTASIAIVEG